MNRQYIHTAVSAALAMLAAALTFTSCTKEQEVGAVPKKLSAKQLHACIEGGADTRVNVDEVSGKLSWTAGDLIDIHTSAGEYCTAELNASGDFSLELDPGEERDGYAIYPSGVVDTNAAALKLNMPSSYSLDESLQMSDPSPMIAVNDPDSDDIYFYHATGTLYLTVDEVPVGTKKIVVSFDKRVRGSFNVQFPEDGHPYIQADTQTGNRNISFILPSALTEVTDGILLKVPVPVGTYGQIIITAQNESNNDLKKITSDEDRVMDRARGRQLRIGRTFIDSMQMIVRAGDDTGWTFTIPFRQDGLPVPSDTVVDWGDGTQTEASEGVSLVDVRYTAFQHEYTSPGKYTITITCTTFNQYGHMIPCILFYKSPGMTEGRDYYPESSRMLIELPTPILPFDRYIDNFNYFQHCVNLKKVCGDFFSKVPNLGHIDYTFAETGLEEIPSGLFSTLPRLHTLSHAFYNCTNLSGSIPVDLFANSPEILSLESVFEGCSNLELAPTGLFRNNLKAYIFRNAFYNCSKLRVSKDVFLGGDRTPADRFTDIVFSKNYSLEKYVDFVSCFRGTLGGVPEDTEDTKGPAPELWTYTIPFTGTYFRHGRCFADAVNGWSNDADIPSGWK